MAAPDAGFQQALNNVGKHLESSDVKSQAAAAVTLALMLQNTPLPADLAAIAARLCCLLESSERAVQRNAAAALSACIESSDTAVQAVIDNRAAERAVQQLSGGSSSGDGGNSGGDGDDASSSSSEDAGLQLNLLVLLGTLGEAGEAAAQSVLAAGGLQQLLRRADLQHAQQLQEAAVDGLCKLAANSAEAKGAAAAAGAIPALAALLTSGSAGSGGPGGSGVAAASAEVQVRALLCLGMLVGGSPERQVELAGVPGAVAALLRLMRQQDDGDCQQIAVGIFRELAGNGAAKEAIAAALKEQQAADAGAQFV